MIRRITIIASILCSALTTINATESPKFEWRPIGRLHLDAGVFNNAPDEVFNSVNITDLRLGAELSFGDHWSAKVEVGFANNKVSLKDAFVQYKYKNNYFRAGNILGPMGLNQCNNSNILFFNANASISQTLFEGRKLGLLYIYDTPNHYLASGMFYGTTISSLPEAYHGGSNYTLRYVFRKRNHKQHLLHIGVSGLYKVPNSQPDPENPDESIRQIGISSNGITYLKSPAYIGTVIDDARHQVRMRLEALWIQRRLSMQAEYLHTWVDSPTLSADYQAKGGYFQLSYLLKGENYGYSMIDAIPLIPTDPHSFALSIRGNITQLNSNVTQLNGDELKGGCQKDVAIGLGYYMNRYVSARLNYSYVWLDQHSLLGKQDFGMLQARIQLCF